MHLIPFSISYAIDVMGIVLFSLFLGYAFGRILRSKKIICVLDFFKIRDTGNLYFWDDLMDDVYPMKIRVTYENFIYEGMLHNYESYSNDPHIILASYIIKNIKGEIVNDFSNDNTKVIILNSSGAINIEILYYKDSEICKDLQGLCKFNK